MAPDRPLRDLNSRFQTKLSGLAAYHLRLRRKKLLWRARRAAAQLRPVLDRTSTIGRDPILCFSTMRNEMLRLPFFLDHHRRLGISHFLIVDNDSDDGTTAYLARQPDVSIWSTSASYRKARFGVDWLMGLQRKYGRDQWCLTLDADEILTYPDMEHRDLRALTQWLDTRGQRAFGAVMLDMYPKGPIGAQDYQPGADPFAALNWFDAQNYTWEYLPRYGQISIRGGPRKRMFFADTPDYAPHLHKTPLIRWHAGDAYVSSTHTALPRALNAVFDPRLRLPTGVLLHTKFLNEAVAKSQEEKIRQQHFTYVDRYQDYYDQVIASPDLWHADSVRYKDSAQLEQLGLMQRGDW